MSLYMRLVAAAIVALLTAGGLWWANRTGYKEGKNEVQVLWDADRLQLAEQHLTNMGEVLARERVLQDNAAETQRKARDEVNRINTRLNAALGELQNRPKERAAAGMPAGAASGVGCTGAGLAGPDAEFLARYAADAGRLQSALNECTARYGDVERALNTPTIKP
jgi:hypothetical protein